MSYLLITFEIILISSSYVIHLSITLFPHSYLVIQEAETDRTFNCLAQNEAGAALVSVDLAVTKQLPEFSDYPADTEIVEDQDLYLDCVVDEESEVRIVGLLSVGSVFVNALFYSNIFVKT